MSNITRLNGNGSNFRDDIVKSIRNEILAGLEKHRMNVEVMLKNPLLYRITLPLLTLLKKS